MTKVIRIIGIVVGAIMAIGAVFGALNTMFATVATRAREIATLRALGFRSVPVRSEEHTSELQSLMRISYAVFCLKKKTDDIGKTIRRYQHKTEQRTIK